MAEDTKPQPVAAAVKAKAGLPQSPQVMEVHPGEGDLQPWDLDTKFTLVGKPFPRLDAPLKVTGRARYTQDVRLPGMLFGRMLGASIPAGEIRKIDTSRAKGLPGVRAVWVTEETKVRFAGQDIAAVAAVSPEVAEDAVRLIRVDYQEQPFVVDFVKAMAADAPLVYGPNEGPKPEGVARNGNVLGPRSGQGTRGDVEKGLAEADVTIEATYSLATHTHACLETHSIVAQWEADQLTVYASTQGVFAVREGLAGALGVDRKNVRVLCEHMGGGFGSKLGPSASGSEFAVVACKLARIAGAPVKLQLDRRQEHLSTGNAPAAQMTLRLGARKDGTLTAIHHRSFGSPGFRGSAGTGSPSGAIYLDTPNVKLEDHDVFTHAGPEAPLRAPGHPQGAFALESAIDELALKLGMDPLELRRKNTSSPVRRNQYDLGAKAIGWERRNLKAGDTPGPKKRGIGMANGVWYVIAADGVSAELKLHKDGGIELLSGAQDIGTGFRTAMLLIAAEELGCGPRQITLRIGDSVLPVGPASGGSNTTNSVAPVVRLVANQAKRKLFELAAPLLKASAGELAASGGRIFVVADPSRAVSLKEAAATMPRAVFTFLADRKKQFETYRWDLAGCQFAEVEVDVETGVVRVIRMVSVNDCGFVVNPLTAQNQVLGAMIQGVSWALLENRVLDRNLGTMVNANLESYKILSPSDMFEAESILTPMANLGNNTSTAGLGEPPMVPTLGCVANAVCNAIGARVRHLPITPDRVLAALAEAGRRA
jgi:xanthine dehydrogenase YagR molybdenum-binding subunit